ncbi:MAG: magnesium transporter [Candidatus Spyradocola sp.]|jgi:magnesium transporter
MERKERLQQLIRSNRLRELKADLSRENPADVAAFLEDLDDQRRLLVFRVLPKDLAAAAFAYLPQDLEEQIVSSISDAEVGQVMDRLFTDDAVNFLEEVPAVVVNRALRSVDPEKRERIVQYLRYPKSSAGSLMTAEYIELHDRLTAGEALDAVRREGKGMESVDVVYTIDDTRRLTGALRLFDLIRAREDSRLQDLQRIEPVTARTLEDQEDVARAFRRYDLTQMPVVDGEGRLVGLITADDVMDVIQQENTEDMERMAAMAPSEKPYLKTSPVELAKKRIVWLLVLMVSATFTGRIISGFEQVLSSVVALAAFIPMLMDTGGNCGSQSSTMVIRGLALGEIRPRDALRVLWKELSVSLLCGVVLCAVNFGRILLFESQVGPAVALAVSLSLLVTVVLAKCLGGLLPIAAKAVHLDPAAMASPLITTVVDAVSLLVYFGFARAILGI